MLLATKREQTIICRLPQAQQVTPSQKPQLVCNCHVDALVGAASSHSYRLYHTQDIKWSFFLLLPVTFPSPSLTVCYCSSSSAITDLVLQLGGGAALRPLQVVFDGLHVCEQQRGLSPLAVCRLPLGQQARLRLTQHGALLLQVLTAHLRPRETLLGRADTLQERGGDRVRPPPARDAPGPS